MRPTTGKTGDALKSQYSLSMPLWAWLVIALVVCGAIAIGVHAHFLERRIEDQQDAEKGIWTDRSTGLLWTLHPATNPLSQWQKALEVCRSLHVDGRTNWRLPWPDEIYAVRKQYPAVKELQKMEDDHEVEERRKGSESWFNPFFWTGLTIGASKTTLPPPNTWPPGNDGVVGMHPNGDFRQTYFNLEESNVGGFIVCVSGDHSMTR